MSVYVQDGHIKLSNLEAFAWTMTALTILICGGRYWASARSAKKLQWDDLTHLLALLSLVAMVGLFQSLFRDGYYITAIERGLIPTPSLEIYTNLFVRFRHRSDGIALLFFTSTWLVKLTFLIFYRSIFRVNKNFRKAWWAVLVFVIISYWITIAGVLTQCGPAKYSWNLAECVEPKHLLYGKQLLKYTCAVSVATDVAIMALPVWMLKDLQMRTSQKVGLGIMFSLGLIVVVFEILRTVVSESQTSFSEVAVFDIIEDCVALIVSSIPSYRSFQKTRRRQGTDGRYLDLKRSTSTNHTGAKLRLRDFGSEDASDTSGFQNELSVFGSEHAVIDTGASISIPERTHI